MKKKRCASPRWFTSLASELSRRNTGKIDVSVAQTSEVLGHLADYVAEAYEPGGPDGEFVPTSYTWGFCSKLHALGRKRLAAKAKAAGKK